MTNDNCKNCGAPYGLHHFETMQCPFGGYETIPNRWDNTHYEAHDDMQERIAKLEEQVAALLAAVPSAKVG